MLLGSPNRANISSELIPWCTFIIFSVLKDEGSADINIVSQDVSNKGASIDVDVSSIGDAESLQGGKLLITELFGADGQVYAIANGSITLGGWGASGKKASVKKNHLVVGRIPSGAIVEKEEKAAVVFEDVVGQDSITRFDRKKKFRRNRRRNRRNR